MKLGFVGAGRVADVHYAALRHLSARAELSGFCDVRPEARQQRTVEWAVPGFASLEDMLNGVDCDALCLFLPHDIHREQVALAARAGKPVLLEKPLAANLADAQAIIETCREAGAPLMVAHNGIFHPAFERSVELVVRKGLVGRPLFGTARSTQWLDFRPWDFRLSRAKTGGGCWMDCAGHLIYRLREFLGEAEEVKGLAGHLARKEMEGEDFASAVLGYRSGAMGQVMVSYGYKLPGYEHDWPQGCEQSLVISGDQGALEYVICPQPRIRLFSEVDGGRSPALAGWIDQATPEPFEASFLRQMEHFLDCVETGCRPRVTGEDALETLNLLLAFYDQL